MGSNLTDRFLIAMLFIDAPMLICDTFAAWVTVHPRRLQSYLN
jgi:hypothetical protein